jgi:hypothetical protein
MNAIARGLVTATVFGLTVGVANGGSVLTYTVSGTATSGQLGTASFTNAFVTFTVIADTSNIVSLVSHPSGDIIGFAAPATSATVNVAGIGTATITSPIIEAYVFQDNIQAGIGATTNPLENFADLGGLRLPEIATYDLTVPIGPLSGTGIIGGTIVQTTLGQLYIPSGDPSLVTFAATVPEPSTLVLAASAALAGAFYQARGLISRRPW